MDMDKMKDILNKNKDIVETGMVVYKTFNYDLFQLSKFNRDPKHYKNVRDSIAENDKTKSQPITVTPPDELGNMVIVDGQNRYLSCKELDKPIYFLIDDDITIEDAPNINTGSKNWSSGDYIKHYTLRGFPEYIELTNLYEKYKVNLSSIIQVCHDSKGYKMSPTNRIRKGTYSLRKDVYIPDFFNHLLEFIDILPFASEGNFIKALFKVYMVEGYNPEHMLSKLNNNSRLVKRQPQVTLFVEELAYLYNYKAGANQRLIFKFKK